MDKEVAETYTLIKQIETKEVSDNELLKIIAMQLSSQTITMLSIAARVELISNQLDSGIRVIDIDL